MENKSSQDGGNRTPFTDLEEQNQKMAKQIIELERTIKEKQKIIDVQDKNAAEKEKKIVELQATISKLIDPTQIVTVQQLREYASCMDPLKLLEKRILLTENLRYDGNNDEWLADGFEIDFDDEDYKIYIQSILSIKSLPADQFPALIEHLCPNNFDWLKLTALTISFDNFKKLISKSDIQWLEIDEVTVTQEDGTVVSVDQLLKEVPNAMRFCYRFNNEEKMEGLAQKFDQLPVFSKLPIIELENIQEGFDLRTYGQFLQKNVTRIYPYQLSFNVSSETLAEMKRIIKEINSTSSFTLQILFI